jgi:hypothetical protein
MRDECGHCGAMTLPPSNAYSGSRRSASGIARLAGSHVGAVKFERGSHVALGTPLDGINDQVCDPYNWNLLPLPHISDWTAGDLVRETVAGDVMEMY